MKRQGNTNKNSLKFCGDSSVGQSAKKREWGRFLFFYGNVQENFFENGI
jgi:hypothetical protein